MDENPGVSLFKANEELEIETNTQRLEEVEALEDEKRKTEEIKYALENAFQDLEGEELRTSDSSCSSSPHHYGEESVMNGYIRSNIKHFQQFSNNHYPNSSDITDLHNFIKTNERFKGGLSSSNEHVNVLYAANDLQPLEPQNIINASQNYKDSHHLANEKNYENTDLHETRLEVLYDIRLKEISRLNNEIQTMKYEFEAEKNKLRRKLMIIEAEKEKAVIARNSAQELLVESKEKISNSEKEIETLKNNLKNTEHSKRELAKELENSFQTVNDLQRRLKTIENFNKTKNDEKQMDNIIKSLKYQHEQELNALQTKYDSITKELEASKNEIKKLRRAVEESESKYNNMLIEKSEIINKLNQSLEQSQSKCHQLITECMSPDKSNLGQLLEQCRNEKKDLEKKVQELTNECSLLKSDLFAYDNSAKYGLITFDGKCDPKNDSIDLLGLANNNFSGVGNDSDIPSKLLFSDKKFSSKLQHELQRSLESNKVKREKIAHLESKLQAAEEAIEEFKKEENKYRTQNEGLVENINKLMQHTSVKEKEWREKENQWQKMALCEQQLQQKEAEIETLKEEIKSIKLELDMKVMELDTARNKFDLTDHMMLSSTDTKFAQEVSFEKERKIKHLELRLDQTLKEMEEVKQLYINICSEKEALLKEKQKCLKQISALGEEKESLSKKMEQINSEKSRLLQQIKDLTDEKEKLLRDMESPKSDDVELQYKKKIEEMEKNHEVALKEVEEQIRSQTIKCFTQEIEKLEVTYRARHSSTLLAKKKLEMLLSQKLNEIEEMKNSMKTLTNDVQKEKDAIIGELKNRIEDLENQIESDREKTAELLSAWMQEVNDMQNENTELKAGFEKMREKNHSLKKTALRLKERAEYFENKSKEDHEKLKKSYDLIKLKYEAIFNKESEITEKLNMLEKVYNDEMKVSKSKNNRDVGGDNVSKDG